MTTQELQSYLEHMDFLTEDQKERVKLILKAVYIQGQIAGLNKAKEIDSISNKNN